MHGAVKVELRLADMEHEPEAAERERLARLSTKCPAWLKSLWAFISCMLALLATQAVASNLKALPMGKGSFGSLFASLLVAVVPLLLMGVSRDLWILPQALKGRTKTWLL